MTFSPLSISLFIPLLIRVFTSHVAGGFLMEMESRKMYQHKPFSERLNPLIKRHMTLRTVTLVSIFSLASRLVPVHHSCFFFCFDFGCHGSQEYHQGVQNTLGSGVLRASFTFR
jgi:hypothetical protein